MKVTYSNPAFPDGYIFFIDALPPLPNGKAVELSEDDLAKFEAHWGQSIEKQLKGDENVKLSSSAKGGN